MAAGDQSPFSRVQQQYFLKADTRKFWWMTQNPYFAAKERELLALVNQLRPARLLEVGSGEGGNLVNLHHRAPLAVGVDLYEDRCRFARDHCPVVRFVCADGYRLPVCDDAFEVVFCRDLLHHIADKLSIIREMIRVCRPGGRVVCIEACGRNPVIFCLAAFVKAERGLLRSNAEAIRSLLQEAGLGDVEVEMRQPLPTYRVLLHPRFGFPSLGRRQWYQRWGERFDRLCARLIPRRWWAYTVVSGRKRAVP